jgi:hypothetical protein
MMRLARHSPRARTSRRAHPDASGSPLTWQDASVHSRGRGGNFFHARREKSRLEPTNGVADAAHRMRGKRLPGRLNLFQSTMLDWRAVHPYNAVHAVRIEGAFDAAQLARAIEDELAGSGLTGLELDSAHKRYAWRGGPAHVDLETLEAAGADWQASLAQAFERQLNAPFPQDGAIDPFRFFAMPLDDAFFLGLAYDHFIAGGDSIIVLLNAIARRYAGEPVAATPLRVHPPTHLRLFLRDPLRFVRGLARAPALVASCRRTVRPRYRAIDDGYNGFMLFRLGAARYRTLRDAAHGWGVTLNDALMALLLLAQDAVLGPRDMGKRRHELAVASIINLRAAHHDDPHATFGQYLGSFRVSHPVPSGITLYELARDVHAATARVKHEKLYLTTLFAMAVDGAIGRFQTPEQRIGIYAKSYPVGAGVSSLNVDALWQSNDQGSGTRGRELGARGREARQAGGTPTYIRGVPTGPLSPIVLAVTTCGGELWGGISYRTSAFGADDIARIRDHVIARIDALS